MWRLSISHVHRALPTISCNAFCPPSPCRGGRGGSLQRPHQRHHHPAAPAVAGRGAGAPLCYHAVLSYLGALTAAVRTPVEWHQQWLDAAQVRGSEVVWLVCSWSQRMRWCGRPVEQGTAVANHCRLPTAARPRPTHPPTHPSTHPPRCLPCLSGCRPAPRGTRLPSSCGSTPRWPSPKTCRRPPAAAACRRGWGRRPPTATRGR